MSEIISGVISKVPARNLISYFATKNISPAFWCRYINGENPVTRREIEFLQSRNCKTALIFDDITQNAKRDVARIRNIIKKLPIKNENAAIIIDTEKRCVREEWVEEIVSSADFVVGFLADFSRCGETFDRVFRRGTDALWGSVSETISDELWNPPLFSSVTPEKISLWQKREKGAFFNEILAANKNVLEHML